MAKFKLNRAGRIEVGTSIQPFNYSQEFRFWLKSVLGDCISKYVDTVKVSGGCDTLPLIWFSNTDEDYDEILNSGTCCTEPDEVFFSVEIIDEACNLGKVQNIARILKRAGLAVSYEMIGPNLGAQVIDVQRAGDNYVSINEDYLNNDYAITAILFSVTPMACGGDVSTCDPSTF